MPRILVTGASSGLGLAFVLHYINLLSQPQRSQTNQSDTIIYALDRHAATSIRETILNHCPQNTTTRSWVEKHVSPMQVDITKPEDIAHLTKALSDLQPQPQLQTQTQSQLHDKSMQAQPHPGLQLVIHCAGIRGLVSSGANVHSYADVRRQETLDAMDAQTMRTAWEVNVLGTFEVLRACVPALRAAAAYTNPTTPSAGVNSSQTKDEREDEQLQDPTQGRGQKNNTQWSTPQVIVMGSRMGSISHNAPSPTNPNAGAAYAYRASKAGVNAVVRSLAVDVPEVLWRVVHPGRVETGLVRIKEDGAISAEDSVGDVVRLIDRLGREEGLGSKGEAVFLDRFGGLIGW